jgi:hypothetical protein
MALVNGVGVHGVSPGGVTTQIETWCHQVCVCGVLAFVAKQLFCGTVQPFAIHKYTPTGQTDPPRCQLLS